MKILPLFLLLSCVAWQVLAQEEGEARPVSRGLLKRGLPTRGKPTTTTTAAPQEEAEYEEDADYPEAESPEPSTESPPPSSTEGKKLVSSGVRPFKSTADLLETLKKRRAQVAEAKSRAPVNTDPAPPAQEASADSAKSSYSGKRRFNNAPAKEVSTNEEAPAQQAKPSRGRFGRPSARSLDPEAEEQNDAAPPARTSRFSRQRGSPN